MTRHILVTGASGYIANRLIPRLLERGHDVRALARHPRKVYNRNWFHQVEVVQGDVMHPASLTAALQGIHTAYYLIHNMSLGRGYTAREREGAHNFAAAAEAGGIEHIIYLGGLADHRRGISPHMSSRIETGASLRQGGVPVTEFRAGVIAGSGSISFEMIRFMTELFPVIPAPVWLKNRSQPIAVHNVMDYLLAALEHWDGQDHVYEIGGPKITNYLELMLSYARARGHRRGVVLLPYVPLWLMAAGVNLMTPVPYPIAYALLGGLSHDSVVVHDEARDAFPEVRLLDFDTAAREALTHLHPHRIERTWEDDESRRKVFKHEGFFIDHRFLNVNATPREVFKVIADMRSGNGWPDAGWLWKLRGWLEGRVAGRAASEVCKVDVFEPEHLLLLKSQLKAPGEGWIEWRVSAREGGARLSQTAYFAPRGLPGFIYWALFHPWRAHVLRGLLRAIAKLAGESLHDKRNP
jgi:uncharacterized protein YbjT (DUF2867 family)